MGFRESLLGRVWFDGGMGQLTKGSRKFQGASITKKGGQLECKGMEGQMQSVAERSRRLLKGMKRSHYILQVSVDSEGFWIFRTASGRFPN